MAFITEPTGYHKTVLSGLQSAWSSLRDAVVHHFGFPDSDRLLFHIDEAMSWECVRNLDLMKETFILIQNISIQANAPEEIIDCIHLVREELAEVFLAIAEGEKI